MKTNGFQASMTLMIVKKQHLQSFNHKPVKTSCDLLVGFRTSLI